MTVLAKTTTPDLSLVRCGQCFGAPELSVLSRCEYTGNEPQKQMIHPSGHSVMGSQWSPSLNWIVSFEYCYTRGTSGVPIGNNMAFRLDKSTRVFAFMPNHHFWGARD